MAWPSRPRTASTPATEGAVVSKAVLNAAERLNVPQRVLSRIIGLSEATVSRMAAGAYTLTPGEKPYELAVLFVRLFRGLDAMSGGDEAVARAWLREANLALGDVPLTMIQSIPGIMHVLAYLDARRAHV